MLRSCSHPSVPRRSTRPVLLCTHHLVCVPAHPKRLTRLTTAAEYIISFHFLFHFFTSLHPSTPPPRPPTKTLVTQPMMQPSIDNCTRRIIPLRTCRIRLRPLPEPMSLKRARAARRRRVELHPVPDDDPSIPVLRISHAAVLLGALAAAVAGADVLDVLIVAHVAIFLLLFESYLVCSSIQQSTVRFRQHLMNSLPSQFGNQV
ncbi:hypothetical protein CC79DRAFT_567075 [Sarocladium strictum]